MMFIKTSTKNHGVWVVGECFVYILYPCLIRSTVIVRLSNDITLSVSNPLITGFASIY